jgi:hypothetical protein
MEGLCGRFGEESPVFMILGLKTEGKKMAVEIKINVRIPEWLDRICAWPVMACRRRKFGYSFRRIPLTRGKYAILSEKDFYRLNNYQWCLKEDPDGYISAVRINNQREKGPTILSMHREIMNAPAGMLVDHRNCNGLDNREENLRFATPTENSCNRRKKTNTSSRFKGVTFDKKRKNWIARIKYMRKPVWLGSFETEIEAARAYDEAARKYHGEFARLNFTP